MEEKLSNFERLCLGFIASQNQDWDEELHQLINVLRVIDRDYDNPVGIYVDFSLDNNRLDLPVLLSADLDLPVFKDAVSFLFYPNTKNQTKTIFLEVVSYVQHLDFLYISSMLKLKLGNLN